MRKYSGNGIGRKNYFVRRAPKFLVSRNGRGINALVEKISSRKSVRSRGVRPSDMYRVRRPNFRRGVNPFRIGYGSGRQ